MATQLVQSQIEAFLKIARSEFGEYLFEAGQCHTLASVVQATFGGALCAIMRREVDDNGEHFSTTYSHMICEIGSACYDIGGEMADERWCERWPEEPDEDGLTSHFDFVPVEPGALDTFILTNRGVGIDQDVRARLLTLATSVCAPLDNAA